MFGLATKDDLRAAELHIKAAVAAVGMKVDRLAAVVASPGGSKAVAKLIAALDAGTDSLQTVVEAESDGGKAAAAPDAQPQPEEQGNE